jgi:hypothetical protein
MTKYVIAGLMAALMTTGMVAGAAFASPASHFTNADIDHDGHLTRAELDSHGCKIKTGIFEYLDENKNGTVEKREFVFNSSLVRRCK